MSALLAGALRTANSVQSEPAARAAAMKLLAYDDFGNVRTTLAGLMSSTQPQPIQVTAVKTLAAFTHPEVAKTLLETWAGATPAVREEILAAVRAYARCFL